VYRRKWMEGMERDLTLLIQRCDALIRQGHARVIILPENTSTVYSYSGDQS
jgi:predicted amidohydrolase